MKDIFCTTCIQTTPHRGEIDQNGEFLFHCQTAGCNRFVKFPQVASKEELFEKIAAHEEVNKAVAEQVQAHTEQQNILDDVLSDGTTVTIAQAEEAAPAEATEEPAHDAVPTE